MTTPPLPPSLTERDLAGIFEVFASASDEPNVFVMLTDEELLGLGGQAAVELTGTPYLDAAEVDRTAVANTALRSLIARGLIVLDPEHQENEGEDLDEGSAANRPFQLERRLAGILAIRQAPSAMLTVNRQVADQTTSIYYYISVNDGILEEFVGADGYHHFSVPTRDCIPERLARYVDQNEVAGDADGDCIDTTMEELDGSGELAERFRDARALSVLTTISSAEATQHSVLALSDAVFLMEGPEEGLGSVTVQECSRASLLEAFAELLPAVED